MVKSPNSHLVRSQITQLDNLTANQPNIWKDRLPIGNFFSNLHYENLFLTSMATKVVTAWSTAFKGVLCILAPPLIHALDHEIYILAI